VQPQLGVSAGGSVTLASLRIKMRLGRGNRCHDHGMVGIRSASGKPHPVHWCRPSSACSSPDGAILPAVTMMVTCLPSRALAVVLHVRKAPAGARLSMTPPGLVPRIRVSR
jgi:hypothetical protein